VGKKVRTRFLVRYCVVLLIAELASSLAVWSGTPTDWVGEPLHFRTFEVWRLKSWVLFFLLALSLCVIGWYSLHRRVHKIALGLISLVFAVAIEVLTSIRFWRQLSWTESAYLGWSHFPSYFWGHLITWIVLLFSGLAVLFFRERQETQPVAHPEERDA
jgi:hypothetical protein